ncbi:MAG: hypothetical protein WD934_09520 [Gemmatimonadales bacterium]
MILANLRHRLTPDDWALVRELVGSTTEQDPDALLDAPGLPQALRDVPGVRQPSVALYVYVLVRHCLLDMGVRDVRMADYLGGLVLEFGDRDRAYRPAQHDDASYRYLVDLLADAERVDARRAFLLTVHLGNFSLWLSGLFPDWIQHRQRRGGPDLTYYEAMGARGYRQAADHHLARDMALDDVFSVAAEGFPRLRIALNQMADTALFPRYHTPDRLMRQAGDAFRYPPLSA